MDKNYRIGFDIGIGSVGWAVLENDPITEEPTKIIKLGVRTFGVNEVEKTGESTAKDRREKRGLHRRTRRRAHRLDRIKKLLKNVFGDNVEQNADKIKNKDVYELRAKALDEKLSDEELYKVIINISKRRGFKSNRKSVQAKDEGALLKAISQNTEFIKQKGYRTIGEAIFKDERFKIESAGKQVYEVRNHGGDYKNCFLRDELKEELNLILQLQKKFGNKNIDDNVIENLCEIFEKQRNFDEGPGEPSPYSAKFEIGECTFIKGQQRAPKASFTFEYFNALSKINSLKIGENLLDDEQKQVLYNYIENKKELKFEQIRKLFDVSSDKFFNLCRYVPEKENMSETERIAASEKAVFVTMKNSFSIKTKLGLGSCLENTQLVDEVAYMLSTCKSDSTIDEYIKNSELLKVLTQQQIEDIKTLNFDKFGSLSIKAMQNIIPYLKNGDRYDVACKNAGYNHSSFGYDKQKYLKGKRVEERLKDITSNVVKRSVNQTLRILNEIIAQYGSPQYVTIELARELSKNRAERNKIEKNQEQNHIKNEAIIQQLKERGIEKPTGLDILKQKLYYEQDGKCMYSGKDIDINQLFVPNFVQVDHILPYSRSMNDSYNNKVLVLSYENQNKGDRTPFEFFGHDEKKWNDFVARVKLIKNFEKRKFLLKQKFGQDEQTDFIERNLNDTKYMSKFLLSLVSDYLEMTSSKSKKQVRSVNGGVTNYLRKCWGINKLREDGDIHHCVDAAVIATVTGGQIQKITTFNKFKEKYVQRGDKFYSKQNGDLISKQEYEDFEQTGIDILSKHIPYPYPQFVKELEIRSKLNYLSNQFSEQDKLELAKLGYEPQEIENAKPVFISRMKTVKTTGAIHKETMMSAREYADTKMLIKTTDVYSLKLNTKMPEKTILKGDLYPNVSIADYYRPQDDRLLYLKLKNLLVENGEIPKTEKIYKPKKDGTNGPLVRSVKTYEKTTNCVQTPNGAAANDTMHRVDVFKKGGKFFLCPVYMSDVYAKTLPNKVIVQGKEWLEIDDSYEFLFSLYKNDLIKITHKNDIVMSKNFKNPKSTKPDTIHNNTFMVYYNSTGIAAASIRILTHDNCYKLESLGVKTLLELEKYHVDIMGNIYKAQKQERKGF